MDSAKTIEIGEAVENMTKLEGWKHVNSWLSEREKEYMAKLKTAENFKNVLEYQSHLKMIDRLRAHIKNSIEEKNKALQNQVKDHS